MIGRRPRSSEATVTQTGGGRIWRTLVGTGLVAGASWFLASIILSPSKRNLEAMAALIFGGILLIASPISAYLFTLVLLPFPAQTSVASTSMLLILVLAAMVVVRGKVEHFSTPFVSKEQDLSLMGWGVMVLLSFYNQNPVSFEMARLFLFGLITAVVLYYVTITLLDSEDRLLLALRTTQIVALVLSILGMAQWLFPDRQVLPEFFSFSRMVAEREEIRRGEVRVMSTFNGQELFAEYLALSVVLQYFLVRWSRSLREKTFWVASMLVLVAALFATATRGGLIILVGGFLYLIVLGARVVPRAQSLRVVFIALAVFYLALGFIAPLTSLMLDRIAGIGSGDSSVQSRSVVLEEAFDATLRQPFIGHGLATAPGTFRGAVSMNIHNLYLTTAYTLGIPGLVAFVWFLIGLWRKSRAVYLDVRLSARSREIALALHVMLVMFVVDQIKIEYLRQPMAMHLAWLNFGFIMASWKIAQRDKMTGLGGAR